MLAWLLIGLLVQSAADLAAMPQKTATASSHDQAGTYTGVPLRDILTKAGVSAGVDIRGPVLATSVVVTGADGYRAVFAIAEIDPVFTDRVILLASQKDGSPLPENARPFQVIVPGELRPARWVRQVVSIAVQTAR